MKDYYAILGISPSATTEEIRRAFRQLALRYHPDVNRSPEATDKFQEITVAYQTLIDPARRAEYDASRRGRATRSTPPPAPTQDQQGARRSYFQRRVGAATDPLSTWNYYDVLGVQLDATEEDIVHSYQRLYREFYHGRDVDPGTAAILQEIVDAREVLTDPDRRLAYDSMPSDQQPPGRPLQQSTPTGSEPMEPGGRRGAHGRRAGCLPGFMLTPLVALSVLVRRLFLG